MKHESITWLKQEDQSDQIFNLDFRKNISTKILPFVIPLGHCDLPKLKNSGVKKIAKSLLFGAVNFIKIGDYFWRFYKILILMGDNRKQ